QDELIGIHIGWETRAEALQRGGLQTDPKYAVTLSRTQQAVAHVIQHLTVTAVRIALTVDAHAIHRSDITQVFDGPCRQQTIPGIASGHRPVGGAQQRIGTLGISPPHRTAQVVADQWAHPPTLELEYHLPIAFREMRLFA